MREPAFWWRPPGLAAGLLSPVAAIYGAVAGGAHGAAGMPRRRAGDLHRQPDGRRRRQDADRDRGRAMLAAAGRRPFLLTRGYGGASAGPVRVDPAAPYRRRGRRRAAAARARRADHRRARPAWPAPRPRARPAPASIVMDDGFQNPALAEEPFDRGGRWRGAASAMAGCFRPARCGRRSRRSLRALTPCWSSARARPPSRSPPRRGSAALPVFHGRLEPDPRGARRAARTAVLAFAGIGDPEKFFATLRAAGIDVRVAAARSPTTIAIGRARRSTLPHAGRARGARAGDHREGPGAARRAGRSRARWRRRGHCR